MPGADVIMRRIRAVAVLAATAAACIQSSVLAAPTPQTPAGSAVAAVRAPNPGVGSVSLENQQPSADASKEEVRAPLPPEIEPGAARDASLPVASRGAPDPVSLRDRERLTGDWGGARSGLSARGIAVQFEVTGFVQGMMSGTGDDNTEPGGRIDALVNFDTARLGLWRGSGFRTHVETAFGDMPAFRSGAVIPMHAATMLPLGTRDEVVATSLYFTQQFGRTASLMVGRINVVDLLADDPFFGGWGIHRFDNIAFVAPPSGLLPPVIVGGLLAVARAPWTYTFMVYDPNDMTAEYLGPAALHEWHQHANGSDVVGHVGRPCHQHRHDGHLQH